MEIAPLIAEWAELAADASGAIELSRASADSLAAHLTSRLRAEGYAVRAVVRVDLGLRRLALVGFEGAH